MYLDLIDYVREICLVDLLRGEENIIFWEIGLATELSKCLPRVTIHLRYIQQAANQQCTPGSMPLAGNNSNVLWVDVQPVLYLVADDEQWF